LQEGEAMSDGTSANVGKRDLSYYTTMMAWTGKEMVFREAEVRARLDAIHAAGIRWIGIDGINLLERMDRDIRDVVRIAGEWFEERGFRLSSFHYAGPTYAPLDMGQDVVRQNLIENVELFRRWTPRAMVIHASWGLSENTPDGVTDLYAREVARHGEDAVVATVAGNLKIMARAAASHGIRLALENMGKYMPLAQPDSLGRLVQAIDEPNVGYCVDSGHAHAFGESVPDWVRQAGDRLFETHFHDNRGIGLDEHGPVGFGTISWIDVILALDDIGFPGPVTFETTGWPLDDVAEGYRMAMAWWRACETLAAQVKAKV
jgi:sugar phosphate isomerase/epimerase